MRGLQICDIRNFQTDPSERRFSRCKKMSGGSLLVSLKEMYNSELTEKLIQ